MLIKRGYRSNKLGKQVILINKNNDKGYFNR